MMLFRHRWASGVIFLFQLLRRQGVSNGKHDVILAAHFVVVPSDHFQDAGTRVMRRCVLEPHLALTVNDATAPRSHSSLPTQGVQVIWMGTGSQQVRAHRLVL